jgi:threonyl-tRNA synthetase
MGPPVETGFYYDVELQHRITPEDFDQIEAEMKKEIKANHSFQGSRLRENRRSPMPNEDDSAP